MEKILNIHKKYVRGKYKEYWLDITWTHSKIVLQIARQFVGRLKEKGISIDEESLEQGILLHDIGVYHCFDDELNNDTTSSPYIEHGFIGYEILLAEGFGEKIARFANTHTGIGLTKEDIQNLKINASIKDYIPITLEEEILCFADKFHSKYPAFSTFAEKRGSLLKYGEINGLMMDRFRMKFGLPNLKQLQKKYDSWQKEIDKFLDSI